MGSYRWGFLKTESGHLRVYPLPLGPHILDHTVMKVAGSITDPLTVESFFGNIVNALGDVRSIWVAFGFFLSVEDVGLLKKECAVRKIALEVLGQTGYSL